MLSHSTFGVRIGGHGDDCKVEETPVAATSQGGSRDVARALVLARAFACSKPQIRLGMITPLLTHASKFKSLPHAILAPTRRVIALTPAQTVETDTESHKLRKDHSVQRRYRLGAGSFMVPGLSVWRGNHSRAEAGRGRPANPAYSVVCSVSVASPHRLQSHRKEYRPPPCGWNDSLPVGMNPERDGQVCRVWVSSKSFRSHYSSA